MPSYDIRFNLSYQGKVRVSANTKKEAEDYVRHGYPQSTLYEESCHVPAHVTIQHSEKVD